MPQIPPLGSPTRLGDLVRFVDSLPEDELQCHLPEICRKVEVLASDDDPAVYARHLVVLGALVNRVLFEVLDVAKDAGAIL